MKRQYEYQYYVKYIIHTFPLYFHNSKGDITSGLNTEVTFVPTHPRRRPATLCLSTPDAVNTV
jgi:hypothetical protein